MYIPDHITPGYTLTIFSEVSQSTKADLLCLEQAKNNALYTPRSMYSSAALMVLRLTTLEKVEKLLFSQAGRLAQRRLANGKKLNHLEATVSSNYPSLLFRRLTRPGPHFHCSPRGIYHHQYVLL